jgi:hypothetical protein
MKRALRTTTIKLAGLLMFLLFSSALAQAQQATIAGVVKDPKGESMAGVSIAVKGTNTGTTTDGSGQFNLMATPEDKLVFSFIGYKTQEVTVGNQTSISLSLEEDVAALSELVVIGYGSVKKTDVTSSIASVSQKDLKTLPVAGIDQAIQGRLAGVTVSTNGGQPVRRQHPSYRVIDLINLNGLFDHDSATTGNSLT